MTEQNKQVELLTLEDVKHIMKKGGFNPRCCEVCAEIERALIAKAQPIIEKQTREMTLREVRDSLRGLLNIAYGLQAQGIRDCIKIVNEALKQGKLGG